MQNIGAVILAAGGSSRFGQPKQLLPFRGKTLVRTIIDAACEAGCSPVVVVIGSNCETIHPELAHANVLEVRNTNWRSGVGSSIRSGVQALTGRAPDVEAVLLLVCDQPAVNAPFIERLIATRETTKKDVIASSYAETVGVPALFNRSLFKELLSLGDDSGAKSIILRSPERVARLAFPKGAFDIDTWEDWEKLNGGSASPKTMGKAVTKTAIRQPR
jgi:molybdenum cofactor cytidylyltransferase